MIKGATFIKKALGFAGVSDSPHFEKTSFRRGKRIFATLSPGKNIACVKLSIAEQSVFCQVNKDWIYPVPNKWGLQGWTNINLGGISMELCSEILNAAYISGQKTD